MSPGRVYSKGFPMGPAYGPLPSLKGSGLWAPKLKVVYNGVTMASDRDSDLGADTRGP